METKKNPCIRGKVLTFLHLGKVLENKQVSSGKEDIQVGLQDLFIGRKAQSGKVADKA